METDVTIASDILENVLDDLAKKEGGWLVEKIKPILAINLERGRIDTLALTSSTRLDQYVSRLAANYKELSGYIQALQIEKDEALWKELFQQLAKWTYAYLIRKGFQFGPNTLEIAIGQATEASIQLLNSHFPYDVAFDLWCHRLVINTCAKFLRSQGRRASHLPTLSQPFEDFAEAIKSPENPELQVETEAFHLRLNSALTNLAPARMHVVQGYYFHGKDFRALAKELGKSVAAIHSLHFHALNDLRAQLELERVEYE